MLKFKELPASDVQAAYEIEIAGFPEDEAASLESLKQRQRNAPQLFLAAYLDQELVGYVCSTLTSSSTLTHDSMSEHDFNGPYVAIHSVSIAQKHQRRGYALQLLRQYIANLKQLEDIKGARLIAHQELVPLYEKAEIELVGKSEVQHGSRPWFEMRIDFNDEKAASTTTTRRSPAKKRKHFGHHENLVDDNGKNKADLYCPRAECRCLLLKRGAGRFVPANPADLQMPALPSNLDTADGSEGFWSVASPLEFENIGFSNSVAASNDKTVKYLTCADCDLGPLGYHDTEGRDLAVEVQEENEKRQLERKVRRLDDVYAIELACFPPDEAETFDAIKKRHDEAAHLFLGAYVRQDDAGSQTHDDVQAEEARKLVAFIAASQANDDVSIKDAMSRHDPNGKWVVIHSVCVDPSARKGGIARRLLTDYIARMREYGQREGLRGIKLMTHDHLIPFYRSTGFQLVGESAVKYGSSPWFEMVIRLGQ